MRGRGGVGSWMDETGPYLPPCLDSKAQQLASHYCGGREEQEHRFLLGPEKPSFLRSWGFSEEESLQDKQKKAEKVGLGKRHSSKHISKQKPRDMKKKKKKKEEKNMQAFGIYLLSYFSIWALTHYPI